MFLRCSPDHHTVNFFKGEARLAHLAFEVKDFPELVRASDLLVRNGFPLDWGPARHTIGHNCACYHRNPDGIRTELYAEMDQMKDEELSKSIPGRGTRTTTAAAQLGKQGFGRGQVDAPGVP